MPRFEMSPLGGVVLSLLGFAFLALPVSAQHGTVHYEERTRLTVETSPEALALLGNRLPTEQITHYVLVFEGSRALMRPVRRDEAQTGTGDEPQTLFLSVLQLREKTDLYTDHEAGTVVERRLLLNRPFVVADTLRPLAWRLTGERAEFLGHTVLQATAQTPTGTRVEAWFTPTIPVPVGPWGYGGLPGLILMLTIGEGERSYVATSVDLAPPTTAIAPPNDGESLTPEAFDALVERRLRELGLAPPRRSPPSSP